MSPFNSAINIIHRIHQLIWLIELDARRESRTAITKQKSIATQLRQHVTIYSHTLLPIPFRASLNSTPYKIPTPMPPPPRPPCETPTPTYLNLPQHHTSNDMLRVYKSSRALSILLYSIVTVRSPPSAPFSIYKFIDTFNFHLHSICLVQLSCEHHILFTANANAQQYKMRLPDCPVAICTKRGQ